MLARAIYNVLRILCRSLLLHTLNCTVCVLDEYKIHVVASEVLVVISHFYTPLPEIWPKVSSTVKNTSHLDHEDLVWIGLNLLLNLQKQSSQLLNPALSCQLMNDLHCQANFLTSPHWPGCSFLNTYFLVISQTTLISQDDDGHDHYLIHIWAAMKSSTRSGGHDVTMKSR